MSDRSDKKWRPFNSVVPGSKLLEKEEPIDIPILSKDEIDEFEEKLKVSLYLKQPIEIRFIENNRSKVLKDYVVKLDSRTKNVYLHTKTINFRQILSIK